LRSINLSGRRFPLVAGLAAGLVLVLSSSASAQSSGGTPPPGSDTTAPESEAPAAAPSSLPTVPGNRAKLKRNGKAIPPANAPANIQNAIRAANQIRTAPYVYGGGHRSFYDSGYDCSGAVSYLLNAAGPGLISAPMPSGPFMSWGLPGKGQWLTVFANGGHAYAVIAGLRWDTSAYGSGSGKGPRWRATKRPPKGFAIRHAEGY
jgi:hypothetical protein